MKPLFLFLLISFCSCSPSGDYKDPDIKKKLTEILSSLHQTDYAARQAVADISAIVDVNKKNLSPEQHSKLTQAASNLTQMQYMLAEQMRLAERDGADVHDKEWQAMKKKYTEMFKEAKTLISDTASTL